jgi:hypothetical protein
VVLGRIGHVLADALLAAAEMDERRHARELRRDDELEPFELVRVDLEVEVFDRVVEGHPGTIGADRRRRLQGVRASLARPSELTGRSKTRREALRL